MGVNNSSRGEEPRTWVHTGGDYGNVLGKLMGTLSLSVSSFLSDNFSTRLDANKQANLDSTIAPSLR